MYTLSQLTTYTDLQLLHLIKQNHGLAWHVLLKRYQTITQRFIRSHINDPEVARDISQEILIKIYQHIHAFQRSASFKTWVFHITMNTLKNHYRSLRRQEILIYGSADEDKSPMFELIDANDPEAQVIAARMVEIFIQDMAHHNWQSCLSVLLFELYGHTYEEIARQTSRPLGTVRSRISRTRQLLARHFGCMG